MSVNTTDFGNVTVIRMGFADFVTLIKENTSNKLENYKELCRFCLEIQHNGIDISDENVKQQRDAVLNDYTVVTKQYLSTSAEYPNFVCSSCKANLRHYAQFVQRIEENAENWEIFLKNGGDAKDYDEFNIPTTVKGIEEIKIEYYDETYANGSEEDTNICDALEPFSLKIERNGDDSGQASITPLRPKKRKIDYSVERSVFANYTTEYERTCKVCNEPTFSSLIGFYKHQRLHHPAEKSFMCDICSSQFNNKGRLVTHMKDRHAKCGKKHQCQFCARMFYSDREMKLHEKSHVNARSYVCNLCGKGFNRKTNLNVHLKSKAHNADYKTIKYKYKRKARPYNFNSKKVFRCQLCIPTSAFSSAEERTAHRNAQHRKFECEVCKNSFMAQESLDCHKLLHSDKPRPFVCSVCNATFNQSSHLASHFKRKHTDKKSFHCSYCDKSFFESCELNAHVRLVHKKQERVKCSKCECDFATDKYLQKHILHKHTTEASPYDCKICGKRTENGVKLDQHRLKHHKIDS